MANFFKKKYIYIFLNKMDGQTLDTKTHNWI